jgi:hypothetical protein
MVWYGWDGSEGFVMSILGLADVPVVEPRFDQVSLEQARLLNAARARLLESGTAITTAMFAEGAGVSEEAARGRVKRHRAARRLVTVLHEGEALIPTFQLGPAYELDPLAARVVAALANAGLGPWAIWDWVETPSGWLDQRTPAEAIRAGDTHEVDRALAGLFGDA